MAAKKKKIIQRIQPRTHSLLTRLIDEAGMLTWAMTRPANFRYVYMQGGLSTKEWDAINADLRQRRAIADLRRQKWLTASEKGNEVILRLSSEAFVAQLKSQVRAEKKTLPEGNTCLVVFDFPNAASSARNIWRKFLLSAGFERSQLSVWSSHKDVCAPVFQLIRVLGISKWVSVYRAHPYIFIAANKK